MSDLRRALRKAGMGSKTADRYVKLYDDNGDETPDEYVADLKDAFPDLFRYSGVTPPNPDDDTPKAKPEGIVTKQLRAHREAVQQVKAGTHSASSAAAARLIPNDTHERHSNASATSKATAEVLRRGADADR